MRKVALTILVLLIALLAWFLLSKKAQAPSPEPVACTMEAKLCPDGSAVGRVPPECEFAPCPEVKPGQSTFQDAAQGFSFSYPTTLPTTFIRAQDWPPKLTVTNAPFACEASSNGSQPLAQKVENVIGQQNFCVATESEGAAGTTYTTYTYSTELNDKLVSLTFTLGYPQCMNYDDPQQSACLQEEKSFDVDKLANEIVQSLKF